MGRDGVGFRFLCVLRVLCGETLVSRSVLISVNQCKSVVRVLFFQITRDVGDHVRSRRYLPTLPGLFPTFVENKTLSPFDAWASLASRLGGPWATLGPPKGHPIPDPIPVGRGSH